MLLDLENEVNELKSQLTAQKLRNERVVEAFFSLKNELAESKKEYTDLYNYNSSAYFTIDNNYLIQTLNFEAALLLGIERKMVLNKSFFNYISLNSKAILRDKVQILQDKKFKQTCEAELISKGGGRKYVALECSLLKNKLISLCLTDNTSYLIKNQNLELKQSFDLINNLFQGASDALAALDKELNLIIVNELFSKLFSKIIAAKINVGMNLNRILMDFPELKLKIIHACEHALAGKSATVVIENPTKNIDLYYCYELYIYSTYTNDNQKKELILRIKNLTDYKLEERIQHQQQSEIALSCSTSAMGEMASALAHEINQPLTAIIAYSRSCLFLMNNDPTYQKTENNLLIPLEKIAAQAELAGEIIHNMKNFMREGNFQVEETNINLLIKDTISILQYELLDFKLKITLELMDNLPQIMTNKIHIMQVILNLARNSIEAFQSGSEINPELTIATTKSANYIDIHIRDNGPGIPREFKNKILNTYFTTKRKGTGIGLGICRTLIEEHGGKLSLEQHEKKGAWFIFTLPLNFIKQSNRKNTV